MQIIANLPSLSTLIHFNYRHAIDEQEKAAIPINVHHTLVADTFKAIYVSPNFFGMQSRNAI